jgi:hypothetical protein
MARKQKRGAGGCGAAYRMKDLSGNDQRYTGG